MTPRRALVALAAACLCGGNAWGKTFQDLFRGAGRVPSPTSVLGQALADNVARSLPVTSASPGVTFHFDPASGSFVRDTDLLGQLYLERARPIGRGAWNVTVSYQRVHIDGVQGQDLGDLMDKAPPIVTGAFNTASGTRGKTLVAFDRYAVDLLVDMVTLAATYGITDRLDVNLTLPILASRLSVGATEPNFTFNPNPISPCPNLTRLRNGLTRCGPQVSTNILHASGVGDMFLRSKYEVVRSTWLDVAGGLVLRMPTGNQDNFQGTGDWELSPLIYLSTPRMPLAGPLAFQAFFNGGFDLNASDVDLSEGRFGLGADLAVGDRATFSVAFLAREPFHGFASAGFFDQVRVNPHTRALSTAPLFGLETDRASYYALSIGGRVNLWRDTVFGFANVLVQLGDQGIQSDPIPLVGFEATF
ncbi:MAG TPA: hypothetical protein VKH82_08275 [Candidatus Binatia bacterium]|nr:hypothetical protein [Candidatus Binatia bacterium]